MSWRPHVLVSFAFWRDNDLARLRGLRDQLGSVIYDSGAFTAHTRGEEVALADYEGVLRRNQDILDEYVQLDVIGDPAATKANYRTMREHGLDPLPVHQYGAPIEDFHAYASERDYVCIGGIAGHPRAMAHVGWISEQTAGTATRLHLLGFNHFDGVEVYRPFSIDSTVWVLGRRFHDFNYFTGSRIRRFKKGDLRAGAIPKRRLASILHQHGFTARDGLYTATRFYFHFNLRAFVLYARYAEHTYGTRVYLAITVFEHLRVLTEQVRIMRERGLLD